MTTEKSSPTRVRAAENLRELIRWAAEARSLPLPEPVRRRAARPFRVASHAMRCDV